MYISSNTYSSSDKIYSSIAVTCRTWQSVTLLKIRQCYATGAGDRQYASIDAGDSKVVNSATVPIGRGMPAGRKG